MVLVILVGPALLSTAQRQLLPSYATSGDILVDTPKVYTRERLVNDRFQQEAWLQDQLDRTDELMRGNRSSGTEGRLTRAEQTSAALAGRLGKGDDGDDERNAANALTAPPAMDFKPNPIDEFRDAQAYRDVIRAELMRTQLTIATTSKATPSIVSISMPRYRPATTPRIWLSSPSPCGKRKTRTARCTGGSMRIPSLHNELQKEIAGAVEAQASALGYSSERLRGTEVLALHEYLQHAMCASVQEITKAIDKERTDTR